MNVEPPEGFRWASGGGSSIGECNGIHVAPVETRGTICGRYGPGTLKAVRNGDRMCGSCARIATARGIAVAARLPDRPVWIVRVPEERDPSAQDGRERDATTNPGETIPVPAVDRTAPDSAPAIRPLRRVRPGVWRSRDDRYEFIGGREIERGADGVWWDSYEVDADGVVANEPVFYARSHTLADAVAEIEAITRG